MVCYIGLLAFRHLDGPCRPGVRQTCVQICEHPVLPLTGPGTWSKSLGPTSMIGHFIRSLSPNLELPQRNTKHAVPGQACSLWLTTACGFPTRGLAGTLHFPQPGTQPAKPRNCVPRMWVPAKAGRDIWGAEPSATSLPWAQRMPCHLCALGRLFLCRGNSFHKRDCLLPVAFSERRMESSRISLNLLTVPTAEKLV